MLCSEAEVSKNISIGRFFLGFVTQVTFCLHEVQCNVCDVLSTLAPNCWPTPHPMYSSPFGPSTLGHACDVCAKLLAHPPTLCTAHLTLGHVCDVLSNLAPNCWPTPPPYVQLTFGPSTLGPGSRDGQGHLTAQDQCNFGLGACWIQGFPRLMIPQVNGLGPPLKRSL